MTHSLENYLSKIDRFMKEDKFKEALVEVTIALIYHNDNPELLMKQLWICDHLRYFSDCISYASKIIENQSIPVEHKFLALVCKMRAHYNENQEMAGFIARNTALAFAEYHQSRFCTNFVYVVWSISLMEFGKRLENIRRNNLPK